ncbi:MAG: cation-translocating P-type ATPase [Dehalococcoidia bacterium]
MRLSPGSTTGDAQPAARPEWHRLDAGATATRLEVDAAEGLSTAEATGRLDRYGPNRLAEAEKEPGWQAFVRQYRDLMQIVLVAAAVINQIVTGETGTTIVLLLLTVFNAVLAVNQESKAEAALASLQEMMKTIARVRRGGQVLETDAQELVPGDLVLLEAGNVVPADGRLLVAATLEIEEAALTGESVPTLKDITAIDRPDVALGDRTNMVFMNTSVTRGRAEMVVTGTGMDTEIGKIAGMLNETKEEKTPLQRKLDELTRIFITLGGVAIVAVIVLGLIRDESLETLFVTGIALAISCIPTGLPAVVTTLLSLGTRELAEQNAIVKRLPAVETLGSTSAICSDKTGTLTLNKMTAREMLIPGPGNRFKVTGEGYSTAGTIKHTGGENFDLDDLLLPMILCADATLDGDSLIGDPTEGALIVLAGKGGLDIDETRRTYPRIAEVPFDSDYKFMATFHEMRDADGQPVVRCFVKGAPDIVIERSSSYWHPDRHLLGITDDTRRRALDANDEIAASGERVMVVAQRDFDPASFDAKADLLGEVKDLTLLAMVGIVDPPRPEAKASIADCVSAGIRVRMITGDHATTAAAIGRELGIQGKALTGAEFAAMSDDEVLRDLDDIGVIARVAPEDKVRLVRLLQERGDVVAMTGDGVNDAPALKKANIGVAMGITGTEVSKGAAVMVITDDNFSTIVRAVSHGRALYDNLLKYIRFQMAALVGYLALFVGAGIFNVANGIPLEPLALLWINFAIDIPIAVALGFDRSTPGLMSRTPRPISAPVLSRQQWIRLSATGLVMAGASLGVQVYGEERYDEAIIGATMLMVSLSLLHVVAGLSVRDEHGTALSRESFPGWPQLRLYGLALLLTVLVTEIAFLQRIFLTTSLTVNQWLTCVGVALALLALEEMVKLALRRREQSSTASVTLRPSRAT